MGGVSLGSLPGARRELEVEEVGEEENGRMYVCRVTTPYGTVETKQRVVAEGEGERERERERERGGGERRREGGGREGEEGEEEEKEEKREKEGEEEEGGERWMEGCVSCDNPLWGHGNKTRSCGRR